MNLTIENLEEKIKQQIIIIDRTISRQIELILQLKSKLQFEELREIRQLFSTNILKILRDQTEHTMFFLNVKYNRDQVTEAIKLINEKCKNQNKPRPFFDLLSWVHGKKIYEIEKNKFNDSNIETLKTFYDELNSTVSHYTPSFEHSEILLMQYMSRVNFINNILKDEGMELKQNFIEFPFFLDFYQKKYEEEIAKLIEEWNSNSLKNKQVKNDKHFYRIYKTRPFYVEDKIYYEIFFRYDTKKYVKKESFFVAYTELEIDFFYTLKFSFLKDIFLNDQKSKSEIPIKIITNFEIVLKKDAINSFLKLINGQDYTLLEKSDIQHINNYLNVNKLNLLSIINKEEKEFLELKDKYKENKIYKFYESLEKVRKIINSKKPGHNILKFIVLTMNEFVITEQLDPYLSKNKRLSNLYINSGSIPFDDLPYNFCLLKHCPNKFILGKVIDRKNYEHDLFTYKLKEKLNEHSLFAISPDVIENPNLKNLEFINIFNMEELLDEYNQTNTVQYYNDFKINHQIKYDNELNLLYYEKNIEDFRDLKKVLDKLKVQESKKQYPVSNVEKQEKINKIINKLIIQSKYKFGILYGAAGTGKTSSIKEILSYFREKDILILTPTYSVLNFIKTKLGDKKITYVVVPKFIQNNYQSSQNFNVVIIDECSMISNEDILKVFKKLQENTIDYVLLVGDPNQIKSIRFGNWFNLLHKNENFNYELQENKRTINPELKELQEEILKLKNNNSKKENNASKLIINYRNELDEKIFTKKDDDEIILCWNYEGHYGINHINHILQQKNPNEAYTWGLYVFKVGDPITFNTNNQNDDFDNKPYYNNLKGIITHIGKIKENNIERITFNIDVFNNHSKSENISLDFSVNIDSENREMELPFSLSYAISIYKAQGLEWNSVKIVFTNNICDLITHNIFYTAVTRPKKLLNIYSTPEVLDKIIKTISIKNNLEDSNYSKFLKKYEII